MTPVLTASWVPGVLSQGIHFTQRREDQPSGQSPRLPRGRLPYVGDGLHVILGGRYRSGAHPSAVLRTVLPIPFGETSACRCSSAPTIRPPAGSWTDFCKGVSGGNRPRNGFRARGYVAGYRSPNSAMIAGLLARRRSKWLSGHISIRKALSDWLCFSTTATASEVKRPEVAMT